VTQKLALRHKRHGGRDMALAVRRQKHTRHDAETLAPNAGARHVTRGTAGHAGRIAHGTPRAARAMGAAYAIAARAAPRAAQRAQRTRAQRHAARAHGAPRAKVNAFARMQSKQGTQSGRRSRIGKGHDP
jgi:hypothetical protein